MNEFAQQIYAVLHEIPHGSVTTYGDVAKLAGFVGYARQVGYTLGKLPNDSQLPWHRVINAKGEISLQGERGEHQRRRLREEGIAVTAQGKVSLRRYRWKSAY